MNFFLIPIPIKLLDFLVQDLITKFFSTASEMIDPCVATDTCRPLDTLSRNNAIEEKADVLLEEEPRTSHREELQGPADTG